MNHPLHDSYKDKYLKWGMCMRVEPFQFVVKDFGMVFWNDNTTTYTAEGAFDYSGVDPINNEGLSIIGDIVPEEAITEKNQKSHTFLAGNLGFHKTPKFKQKGIQPIFGIDVYFTRSLIPRGYIGAFVKPAKWFDFNASIAYGGYGGIQDHIGLGFNIKKAVRLGVFSHNTFSSIINAGYGYSLGFSIIGQW